MSLPGLIDAAWQRRAALHRAPHTTAYRLINRAADGFPDLAVDRYGDALVAHVYSEGAIVDPPMNLLRHLAERAGAQRVYVKYRPAQANTLDDTLRANLAPSTPVLGQPVEHVTVLENDLRFEIRPGDGLNPGLFPDMREVRARVRSVSAGRTVLNTFAYTCGFGVAVLMGGAARAQPRHLAAHSELGRAQLRLERPASGEDRFPGRRRVRLAAAFRPARATL